MENTRYIIKVSKKTDPSKFYLMADFSLTNARKDIPRWDEDAGEYHTVWIAKYATKKDVKLAKDLNKKIPEAHIKEN